MQKLLDCSAIVVIKDAGDLAKSCLNSLRESSLDEVIFVDGGSTDGTAEFLRGQTDLHLLEMPGAGVIERLLAGVRSARNDYVLLQCDDDLIRATDVQAMLETLESDSALDGLQFQISTRQGNFWEHGWNTYFALITKAGMQIAALGRPCVAKRSIFLDLHDPPEAFGDDTWIHLQEEGKQRKYFVGPGATIRSCPNNASWNARQFRKYGEADSEVCSGLRHHAKLLFHTAIRIAVFRSLRAVFMGRPFSAVFIALMGLSRTYHHLVRWFSIGTRRPARD